MKGKNLNEVDIENIDEGVRIPGVTATHPLTGKEIPIFVTSYVHGSYGTGAIMGVPFHDERDCAFALANELEIVQVISEAGMMCNCADLSGMEWEAAKV